MTTHDAEALMMDALLERPIAFRINETERFDLYPPTLGVHLLSLRLLSGLQIDEVQIDANPIAETLRLVRSERSLCLRLIALRTLRGYEEISREALLVERMQRIGQGASDTELAELLLLTLRGDHYDALADHYGITKEGEERRRLSEAKTDEGTRFFGGRTIYGGLLDFALSRYGWTLTYCLWEISYFNLRMLVADATTSVYLSEEERKRLGSSRINADDPRNRELIRDLLRED